MKTSFSVRARSALWIPSLLIGLAGCASAPAPLPVGAANRIERIGIISSTARVLTRQVTGVTVFGNELEELDVSSWKVDEQYEHQLAAEAGKLAGITVVRAPYPAHEFVRMQEFQNPMFHGLGQPNWEAIEPASRNYCAANRLDALLVVSRSKMTDTLGVKSLFYGPQGTNQTLGGAGTYARRGRSVSYLHLVSRIALIDCKTAKPIAVRVVSTNPDAFGNVPFKSVPLLEIPEEISRTPMSQWTREQKHFVQTELVKLPQQAWPVTLRSMLPSRAVASQITESGTAP